MMLDKLSFAKVQLKNEVMYVAHKNNVLSLN